MRALRSSSSGFTIVELLTGIIITGLFIGAVATLITNNTRIAQRSRDLATTNSFAENKMESLRSIGFSGLNNSTTNLTSELPSELKSPRSATQTITSLPGFNSVKKVELSITYNDQGQARTYNYSSYIGELGVGQY